MGAVWRLLTRRQRHARNRSRIKTMATPARTPLTYKLAGAVKAPAKLVNATVDDTRDLLRSSGHMQFGQGIIATVLAL
jgi:phosphoribosyl-dephospho-CoA transferase